MNVVITHGFAHRLRTDGLTESAPFDSEKLEFGEWKTRGAQDMDLSGGDWVLIVDTLKRLRQVFQFTGRRTPPAPTEPSEKKPEASEVS